MTACHWPAVRQAMAATAASQAMVAEAASHSMVAEASSPIPLDRIHAERVKEKFPCQIGNQIRMGSGRVVIMQAPKLV